MIDATKATERWKNGMSGAATKYKEGVQAFTGNPMELAAQNKQGWLNGINEAANSGKWEAGLRRNGPQYWKDQAINVGAARLGTGAMAASPKVQAFFNQFLPFLQSVTERVRSMPATNFEERKARAIAQMDGVHQFRRS